MSTKPLLYSFWRSSCSWRVRTALNFKEIIYEIKPIDIFKQNDQFSEEFTAVNPMQFVPALIIDGHTLIESSAIINYLEETRPEKPLLPKDAFQRARVRAITEIITSGIQPLQNVGFINRLGGGKNVEIARTAIRKGFNAIETLLTETAGKYSVGDDVTIADCCLVPQVYNAKRYKIDLTPYPFIQRINNELENHPAFAAGHPSKQPDCPE